MTVLNRLIAALRDADNYNRHDLAEPCVVLWTDGDCLWSPVMSLIQEAMPELLVLDPTDSGPRRGPSTVIRYLLARGEWKETPVVYLPGIARQAFRGAAGFPEVARHLYALQFQGQFWAQVNGKDWTPLAFLTSGEGGLGLEVARDTPTKDALAEQLENLLRTPLADLADKRLEAADFHALATSDPIRSLLQWMSAPELTRKEWKPSEWKSFCGIAKQQFGLDPEKDGPLTAAERLAEGQNHAWNEVWKRYKEAPRSYGGVRQLLANVYPKGLIATHDERLPTLNQEKEAALRRDLAALVDLPNHQALSRLTELCQDHAKRIKWVWVDLDEAPLAQAAFHLGVMAHQIASGLPGHDWEHLAKVYASDGWLVDTSAWRALAQVREAADSSAVATALRVVYLPWLEGLADRVLAFTGSYPTATPLEAWTLKPEPGTIVLFVDGLRFDLGSELKLLLEQKGLEAGLEPRWTGLPTVTATAKPAWAPLTMKLNGNTVSEGFEPGLASTGKPLKTAEFRNLLTEIGYTWTESGSPGNPSQPGWTETGSFDRHGHDEGAHLAWRIEDELKATAQRIRDLLKSGWKKVLVMTDHGWLLMPGGLPKVDLPKHLTVSRWGRCALPEPGANHGFRQTPWFWGGEHSVVLAPGVSAFKAGMEYAHGGLTLQEALTPFLTVSAGKAATAQTVKLESLRWVNLRLQVQLSGNWDGVNVDIRTKAADGASSLLPKDSLPKGPDDAGKVSLAIEDADRLGESAAVVVVREGQVIAKQTVTVGGD